MDKSPTFCAPLNVVLSCSTTARRESLGERGCDVDSGTTLAMRLSISFSFCSPGHLVCEISRDLRLYSKISSRTTQINSVLDVGYNVDSGIDPWSLQLGHGPTRRHFIAIFDISIGHRKSRIYSNRKFFRRKTPQNATSHFQTETERG